MEDNNNREQLINLIKDNFAEGYITIMTENGLEREYIEDILKQPAEMVLYDLNRDFATLFTQAKTSKSLRFVNDIACAHIIKYLLNVIDDMRNGKEEPVMEVPIKKGDAAFAEVKQADFAEKIRNNNNTNKGKGASVIQEGFNTDLQINI